MSRKVYVAQDTERQALAIVPVNYVVACKRMKLEVHELDHNDQLPSEGILVATQAFLDHVENSIPTGVKLIVVDSTNYVMYGEKLAQILTAD